MKEHVVEIVAAYLRKNAVSLSDMPSVITQAYQSLAANHWLHSAGRRSNHLKRRESQPC